MADTTLSSKLQRQAGVAWTEVPLRQGLETLAQRHRVVIWLDRRIDPGQRVSINRSSRLETLLQDIAAQVDCDVGRLDMVVYVGPPPTASLLATVAHQLGQQARALPPTRQQLWLQRSAWSWNDLAEPRQLLTQQANRLGIRIDGVQAIPHDLLRRRQLPPLSTVDRLLLIAAGFGKSIALDADGSGCRLIAWPEAASYPQQYTLPRERTDDVDALIHQLPDVPLEVRGRRLVVDGRWEDHQRVRQWLAGAQDNGTHQETNLANRRFSLRAVNQPTLSVVRVITDNVGLTLQVDARLQDRLQRRTSVQLREATFQQAMQQLLEPLDVAFQLDGKTVQLRPAQPPAAK